MKKIDSGMITYLMILIVSWVIIIVYFMYLDSDTKMKKELESYPYEHSKITDSTLNNGK